LFSFVLFGRAGLDFVRAWLYGCLRAALAFGFNCLGGENVDYNYINEMKNEPHPSHEMTEWESTIVTIISTSRFGKFRKCKNCGAEQAETVAGKAMHEELKNPCLLEN